MRSQIRFFLHPGEEVLVFQEIVSEDGVVVTNGSNWPTAEPPVVRDVSELEGSADIWSPMEFPNAHAERVESRKGNFWSFRDSSATVQWILCQLWDSSVLTEGRFAIATSPTDPQVYPATVMRAVERRSTNV